MPEQTPRRPSPLASRRLALIAVAVAAIATTLPSGRPETSSGPAALRINPSTAPAAVLEALPRIGPATAAKVVEARATRPFADLDDFDRRVRGIGPVTREALRPYLRFEAAASPPSKDR